MNLSQLNRSVPGKKPRRRIGRGNASGWGKSAGRGEKGQHSRSGYKRKDFFEGGQMPIARRIPKRGFSNAPFKKRLAVVNLRDLAGFEEGTTVTPELLAEKRIVHGLGDGLKVLGVGELDKALVVRAHRFSRSAREAIERAGGVAEPMPLPRDVAAKKWRAKRRKWARQRGKKTGESPQ